MNEPRVEIGTPAPVRGGMEPLALLPVFFPLAGRRAVLAGATERAVWKAELLAAPGAKLDVYAAVPCAEMRDLLHEAPRLTLHEREWVDADLDGAAIALVDTEEPAEVERFRAAARTAGVPMNATTSCIRFSCSPKRRSPPC